MSHHISRSLRTPRLTLAILAMAPATPATAQDLVLSGGTVIEVQTGVARVASILIRDGVIDRVSPTLTAPPGATVLDVAGRWIVPGLTEMHTHTTDTTSLRMALALGVTSTLTIYTGDDSIPPRWEAPSHIPSNAAPRMHLVGGRFRVQDMPRGQERPRPMMAPTTPEEVAEHLDAYRAGGVTRIKIWVDDGTVQFENPMPTFNDRILSALVAGARARNMTVFVHALTGELYRRAVAAGPTWIIHPMVTDELTTRDVEALKASGLGWTTVMSIVLWNGDPRRYARMSLADPRLVAAMPPEVVERHRVEASLPENPHLLSRPRIVDRASDYLATIRRNMHLAVESDLTISVGSDRTVGYGTHLEIELLRDAGLDAQTILRASTLGGAEALGVSDAFGSVDPGKVADLVVLSSNPLQEITNLRDVELVLKGGRIWRASELLEGAARPPMRGRSNEQSLPFR